MASRLAKQGLSLAFSSQQLISGIITRQSLRQYMPLLVSTTVRATYPALRHISTTCYLRAEEAKSATSTPTTPTQDPPAVAEPPPVTPVISHDDVIRCLQHKRATIIDTRTQLEMNVFGKIPGAVNLSHDRVESAMSLPGGEFKVNFGFYKPDPYSSESIVVYCRSGKRAEAAGKVLLKKFGIRNVFNYEASWTEWEKKHPEHVKAVMPSGDEYKKFLAEAASAAGKN